jgi:hypothetical protein
MVALRAERRAIVVAEPEPSIAGCLPRFDGLSILEFAPKGGQVTDNRKGNNNQRSFIVLSSEF